MQAATGGTPRWAEDEAAAIRLNPDRAEYYYEHGMAVSWYDEWEIRLADYEKAAALAEKNKLPDAAEYRKRLVEARDELPYNVEARDHPEAYAQFKKGRAKLEKKDYAGARADYDEAIRLNPRCALYYWRRGGARGWLDDDQGNVDDQTKAIELDPRVAVYFYSRGLARAFLEPQDQAQREARCADLEKAVSLLREFDPTSDDLKEYSDKLAKARSELTGAATKP